MLTLLNRIQNKISVRRAKPEDIETLIAMKNDLYAESNYSLDQPWAEVSFDEMLACPLLNCIWLVHSSTAPIGHAVLTVRYTREHGGLCGYIDELYIKPSFKQKGASNALFYEIFSECHRRGCKSICAEVGEINTPEWELYETFGLRSTHVELVVLNGMVHRLKK